MAPTDQCIYWERKQTCVITKELAQAIVADIRKLMDEHKDIVALDYTDAKFNDTYNVNFNGLKDDGMESFQFYTPFKDNEVQAMMEHLELQDNKELREYKESPFDFCATGSKPYELVVKKALMIMQKHTNDGYRIIEELTTNKHLDPPGWDKVVTRA